MSIAGIYFMKFGLELMASLPPADLFLAKGTKKAQKSLPSKSPDERIRIRVSSSTGPSAPMTRPSPQANKFGGFPAEQPVPITGN